MEIESLETKVAKQNPSVQEVDRWDKAHEKLSLSIKSFGSLSCEWASLDKANEAQHMNEVKAKLSGFNKRLTAVGVTIDAKAKQSDRRHSASDCLSSSPASKGYFKKMDYPTFSGKLEDYASFRRKWRTQVDVEVAEVMQVDLIKEKVPDSWKAKIKMCQTMKDVWAKLDGEFGAADEVALRLLDRFQA